MRAAWAKTKREAEQKWYKKKKIKDTEEKDP